MMIFKHNGLYLLFFFFSILCKVLHLVLFPYHNSLSWVLISSTSLTLMLVSYIVGNAHPPLHFPPTPQKNTHTDTLCSLTYFPWLPTGHILSIFLSLAMVPGFYSLLLAVLHIHNPLFFHSFRLFLFLYSAWILNVKA